MICNILKSLHEIKKIIGQKGYILAEVFNLDDTNMGGKKEKEKKKKKNPTTKKTATDFEISKACFTPPFIDSGQ
jgi:hypothetical protein